MCPIQLPSEQKGLSRPRGARGSPVPSWSDKNGLSGTLSSREGGAAKADDHPPQRSKAEADPGAGKPAYWNASTPISRPGNFVLTQERLDDLVPIEPAAMENRQVIEWDKDDIDTLVMAPEHAPQLNSSSAVPFSRRNGCKRSNGRVVHSAAGDKAQNRPAVRLPRHELQT